LYALLKVGSTSPVEDFQALVADTDVSFSEGCTLHSNIFNFLMSCWHSSGVIDGLCIKARTAALQSWAGCSHRNLPLTKL